MTGLRERGDVCGERVNFYYTLPVGENWTDLTRISGLVFLELKSPATKFYTIRSKTSTSINTHTHTHMQMPIYTPLWTPGSLISAPASSSSSSSLMRSRAPASVILLLSRNLCNHTQFQRFYSSRFHIDQNNTPPE